VPNAIKFSKIPPIIRGLNLMDTPVIIINNANKIKKIGARANPKSLLKIKPIIIRFKPTTQPMVPIILPRTFLGMLFFFTFPLTYRNV
jgi:hypothetical protein